jgi:hypothetical protein
MAAKPENAHSPLLRLPTELRLQILSYLPDTEQMYIYHRLYYSINTFHLVPTWNSRLLCTVARLPKLRLQARVCLHLNDSFTNRYWDG